MKSKQQVEQYLLFLLKALLELLKRTKSKLKKHEIVMVARNKLNNVETLISQTLIDQS